MNPLDPFGLERFQNENMEFDEDALQAIDKAEKELLLARLSQPPPGTYKSLVFVGFAGESSLE
jgi:hypothetical protein